VGLDIHLQGDDFPELQQQLAGPGVAEVGFIR
jgi:hypothetical protein